MPTALFNKARTAGVIALAVLSVTAAAIPAQAASILRDGGFSIEIGGGNDFSNDRHDDCDSRREIKYYFQDKYDLRHVDVSKTHDYYIYRVSGYAQPAKEAPALLREKSSDYVKYVFLFDACDHEIIKQLQPKKVVEVM